YEKELAYQQEIDRIANALALGRIAEMSVQGGNLIILFPDSGNAPRRAELELMRPSDRRADSRFTMEPSDQRNWQLDISNMMKGHYKARLFWTRSDTEYVHLQEIYLP
ncbi:MAG: FixH family protein, partial [Flavobacteriales bacterium]|nr:FixH family protein [Flavobacteriales bacterium]